MKLKPLDISKQEFDKKLRGYDPEEVRTFLQEVARQWQELDDENRRFQERNRELEAKLKHYERVEEALEEALKTARESSKHTIESAEKQAERIVAEAEARASAITHQAQEDRTQMQRETEQIGSKRKAIAARLRAFLMSEMEMLAHFEGEDPIGFIKLLPSENRTYPTPQLGQGQGGATALPAAANPPAPAAPPEPTPASEPASPEEPTASSEAPAAPTAPAAEAPLTATDDTWAGDSLLAQRDQWPMPQSAWPPQEMPTEAAPSVLEPEEVPVPSAVDTPLEETNTWDLSILDDTPTDTALDPPYPDPPTVPDAHAAEDEPQETHAVEETGSDPAPPDTRSAFEAFMRENFYTEETEEADPVKSGAREAGGEEQEALTAGAGDVPAAPQEEEKPWVNRALITPAPGASVPPPKPNAAPAMASEAEPPDSFLASTEEIEKIKRILEGLD